MSSPNEPGSRRTGRQPEREWLGRATRRRRRGAAQAHRPRPSQPPQRQSDGPQPRPAGRASASPSAEARLNRFISGTAAPGAPKRHHPRPSRHRLPRRTRAGRPMPTPASCPTCPARSPCGTTQTGRRTSRTDRDGTGPRREDRPGVVADRGARCAPACRSGESTRGAR